METQSISHILSYDGIPSTILNPSRLKDILIDVPSFDKNIAAETLQTIANVLAESAANSCHAVKAHPQFDIICQLIDYIFASDTLAIDPALQIISLISSSNSLNRSNFEKVYQYVRNNPDKCVLSLQVLKALLTPTSINIKSFINFPYGSRLQIKMDSILQIEKEMQIETTIEVGRNLNPSVLLRLVSKSLIYEFFIANDTLNFRSTKSASPISTTII